jgi:hypothetical protein
MSNQSTERSRDSLQGMAFDAYTHGDGKPTSYGDDDVFKFHEGGVLELRPAEETKKHPTYLAPHLWDQIIASPPSRITSRDSLVVSTTWVTVCARGAR